MRRDAYGGEREGDVKKMTTEGGVCDASGSAVSRNRAAMPRPMCHSRSIAADVTTSHRAIILLTAEIAAVKLDRFAAILLDDLAVWIQGRWSNCGRLGHGALMPLRSCGRPWTGTRNGAANEHDGCGSLEMRH